VQVRYRIEGDRAPGTPLKARLWFWSQQSIANGMFNVSTSSGVELIRSSGDGAIPEAGKLDVSLLPKSDGYHYIVVETVLTNDGVESRHRTAIPVPVGIDRMMHTGSVSGTAAREAFSGPRGLRIRGQAGATATHAAALMAVKQ
jgi:hypothetical protein